MKTNNEEVRKRVKLLREIQNKLNIDVDIDISLMLEDLEFLIRENDKLSYKLLKYEKRNSGNHIPRID